MLLLIALLQTCNSISLVYATPPDRTPPLVQSVLLTSSTLFVVPFSKWILGDNKKYLRCEPHG
jgi:hypothetical protein